MSTPDDSGQSSRKRTRNGPIELDRHSLWFEDGNIILRAQNTAFKVHRSLLGRHSTVFEDMFQVPQPTSPGESIDSVPLVELHDDPQELGDFLDVIYNGAQ